MSKLSEIRREIRGKADPERAGNYKWFFKTGKGEYGEGDVFLGLRVPDIRIISKKFLDLKLADVAGLLHSKYHEERLCALLILVVRYAKGDNKIKKQIFDLYLKNTKWVNNWDLVDLSASRIVGQHLIESDKSILYKLANSKGLWEKRIVIIATAWFIIKGKFEDTLKISEILLNDKHDLIHKAVGWMLREVGKKSLETEEKFLQKYVKKMPRTMLRYAIEKFPKNKRKKYLAM